MQKLELFPSPLPSEASAARARRRREASYETNEPSRFGEANLTVEDYVRLILTHFHEAPNSAVALRVSVSDVRHAAQAAVIADLQILDAKSSSGLRWEKGAPTTKTGVQEKESDTLSVTPKLVRYQLEEKKNRHMALLDFLQRRCVSVWEFIENSTELQCELAKNEEKLQAAIALCKLQASILSSNSSGDGVASETQCRLTGKFILHAIEKTVVKRGYRTEQLRLAGYNSFDVFYSEVSKITELFERLNDEVQSLSTAVSESDPAYLCGLLESGCAMLSMLCTPVQGSAVRFAPAGSRTLAHEVRKVVVNQISRLSTLVGYSQPGSCERQVRWQYDEIFEVMDQIRRLGTVLLDDYGSLIPLSLRGDADDLRAEEAYTKRVTLDPLVYFATQTPFQESEFAVDFGTDGVITRKRANLFHQCVELCEKYCYFEGMVYLVLIEDSENLNKLDCVLGKLPKSPASKRLELYCKKHEGFDDFIFRWYNGEVRNPWTRNDQKADASSRTMLAYLLAHSQLFAPMLHKFMSERDHLKKYCWLTAISIERYDQVVTLALHEAKEEQQSLPKRKTMASIAKIAAFASPSLSHPDSVQEIDRELVRGKLQELLLQLPLESPVTSQPLSPEELVDTCLASAFSVEKDDPMRTNLFLMALEALDTLAADLLTEKYKDMRAGVWRSCIVDDGKLWDDIAAESAAGVNEENTEVLMRQTLLYKAMKEYTSRSEHPVGARPASALTIEVIEELVRCEGDVDSAVSDQTQQLLMKTLHLALQ
uniref:Nucleoporin n=1 Tax=Peronospora matthiolae TaxID=2874970 RepID=A0AAV1UQG5_9STRA